MGQENQPTELPVGELGSTLGEDEIRDEGFVVSNLVGTLHLGRELDLDALSSDIENTEYNPERYSSMIYSVTGTPLEGKVSVLTPSSGQLIVVGAKNKQELVGGVEEFLGRLESLGIDVEVSATDLFVQNIVANYDLGVELDLDVVSIALGLENVEYEPEQFPGLVYRPSGNATVLIFGSGKCVITGAKTYRGVLEAKDEVVERLQTAGVDVGES